MRKVIKIEIQQTFAIIIQHFFSSMKSHRTLGCSRIIFNYLSALISVPLHDSLKITKTYHYPRTLTSVKQYHFKIYINCYYSWVKWLPVLCYAEFHSSEDQHPSFSLLPGTTEWSKLYPLSRHSSTDPFFLTSFTPGIQKIHSCIITCF